MCLCALVTWQVLQFGGDETKQAASCVLFSPLHGGGMKRSAFLSGLSKVLLILLFFCRSGMHFHKERLGRFFAAVVLISQMALWVVFTMFICLCVLLRLTTSLLILNALQLEPRPSVPAHLGCGTTKSPGASSWQAWKTYFPSLMLLFTFI